MSRTPLVNFAVIGAQKSGTTALRYFLSQHPEIGVTKGEPHYFDRRFHEDTSPDYALYHGLFPSEALDLITGDVTPIYLYLCDCLDRMKVYNPEIKIIVLLRDPVERAYSQWIMQIEKGEETRGFALALLHEAWVLLTRGPDRVFSYVQRGLYDRQLDYLFTVFPLERCLVLKSVDLRDRHEETLCRVFSFLGVNAAHIPPPELVHVRHYKPMPRWINWLLRRVFARDMRRLERRLGWRRADWRR